MNKIVHCSHFRAICSTCVQMVPNYLSKTGATLATEPGDFLEALAPMTGPSGAFREVAMLEPVFEAKSIQPAPEPDADNRARVTSTLGQALVAVDDIARATSPDIHSVRTVLIEFDLAGLTERRGAQLVSLLTAPSAEASGLGPIPDNGFVHCHELFGERSAPDSNGFSRKLQDHIAKVFVKFII